MTQDHGDQTGRGGRLYCWSFANAEFDEARWQLRVAGQDVELEHKPLEVLQHLLRSWEEGRRVAAATIFMARTFDDLFPALVDFANLHAAWEKAAQGKRRRGCSQGKGSLS